MSAAPAPGRARRYLRPLVATALVLLFAEGLARFHLPATGVTPFCAPRLVGLPSDLRTNFETIYSGVPVRTNGAGLRGGPILPREPGRMRVALVGDSFTFGSGVHEEHTLSNQLELALFERGQRAEVLNFGVPGYNAEDVLQVALERAMPMEPDALVYIFFANDIDPRMPRADPAPDRVIVPRLSYLLRSAALQWLFLRTKNLAIAWGVDVNRRARERTHRALEGGGRERLVEALDLWAREVASAERRTCIVLYPFLTPTRANPFEPVDELLREAVRERGLELLDLAPLLTQGRPHSLWANQFDSHPGPEANRRAARALAERLVPGPGSGAPAGRHAADLGTEPGPR